METNQNPIQTWLLGVVLLALPAVVQAQFTFTTNNGTITITRYTGSGGSVTIPSTTNGYPVTSIGNGAFFNKSSVTNIILPDSITSIGTNAFSSCGLTSVTIPNTVTSLDRQAFESCLSLTSVVIGNSVTNIGLAAFSSCYALTSIVIGKSVNRIESQAFAYCSSLASVYFQGNSPNHLIYSTGIGENPATVYYLPGTTGWGATFDDYSPAVLWNPQAQTNDTSFGVRTNRFGFNITGSSNLVIVVEACTNFTNPVWSIVATNTLANGLSYFSDVQWTNYPGRFYRLRSP